MAPVQLELWQLITLLLMFFAAVWGAVQFYSRKADEALGLRFAALNTEIEEVKAGLQRVDGLKGDIHRVELSLSEFKAHAAETYLAARGFNEFRREFNELVGKLFERMNSKVDRSDCRACDRRGAG